MTVHFDIPDIIYIYKKVLILLCLEFSLAVVVWTYDIFGNNFENRSKFSKLLKVNLRLRDDEHISFKYLPHYDCVAGLTSKLSVCFYG